MTPDRKAGRGRYPNATAIPSNVVERIFAALRSNPMTKGIWAGLDVGVETTAICIVNDAGEIVQEAVCATSAKSVHREIGWIKRRRHARVALEAGTGVSLARGLRALGYSVEIYESRRLSKFLRARRNKTDAGDANGIAEAARLGVSNVSKVYLKDFETQALQSRLTIRRHLLRERLAAVSLLCRQIELYGGRIRRSTRDTHLREAVEPQLKRLFGRAPSALSNELRDLLDRCEQMIEYQRAFDEQLRKLALDNAICRRLMTIPGVGPLCALTFYAAVGEPERFARSADIGAYFGLAPTTHESGLTVRPGRISRMGNAPMRRLLVQAAMAFMRWADPACALKAWALQIEQRRGRPRAKVALARKLAVLMLTLWRMRTIYLPQTIRPLSEPQKSDPRQGLPLQISGGVVTPFCPSDPGSESAARCFLGP